MSNVVGVLVNLINLFAWLLVILVMVKVILSYFLPPYHPVRETIDRLSEPLLIPIRRIVPQAGIFDFSPLILIILIQIVASLLSNILFLLF